MDQKRLRIGYLFKRARRLNPTQLVELARQVKKVSKAPLPVIIVDMLWCAVRYEMGFRDYVVWDIRLLTAKERRTWMTHPKAFRLNKTLNAPESMQLLADKARFLTDFADLTRRDWIDAAAASDEDLTAFLGRHPRVIAKPVAGEGGAGIAIYETAAIDDVAAWRTGLIAKDQTLLEEVLRQHDDLAALYPDSVNTVRMITYRDPQEKLHVIAAVLRIGNGAVIDNFASGGMFTMLDDTGTALYPGVDKQSNIYREHPVTGTQIEGLVVPFFAEVVALVSDAATRLPTIPYVGWDIAVTPSGPALIEANHNSSVFQMKPSASGIRTGLLHRYRDAIGADIVDKR